MSSIELMLNIRIADKTAKRVYRRLKCSVIPITSTLEAIRSSTNQHFHDKPYANVTAVMKSRKRAQHDLIVQLNIQTPLTLLFYGWA